MTNCLHFVACVVFVMPNTHTEFNKIIELSTIRAAIRSSSTGDRYLVVGMESTLESSERVSNFVANLEWFHI